MGAETMKRWSTWEELLLGGAILRHGTDDWNIVATELRPRTGFPYTITPQVKNTQLILFFQFQK